MVEVRIVNLRRQLVYRQAGNKVAQMGKLYTTEFEITRKRIVESTLRSAVIRSTRSDISGIGAFDGARICGAGAGTVAFQAEIR
jgi:hypothetical protein